MMDGETFDADLDGARLSTQLGKVERLMRDGRWRTLAEIREAVGGSEAGVSARLRDLRKTRFGAWTVERRRESVSGLWAYRMVHQTSEKEAADV